MAYYETKYLLSERNNPHSSVRSNGVRFWGYPSRVGGLDAITCIVVHTTENDPSPATAENVARWQASTASAPSSYHVIVDSDSIVRTLADSAVAFHAVGFNTRGLGLSFGTKASAWGKYPVWDREALRRAAWVAARWAERYDIPIRWITKAQAERGVRGFLRHSVADPTRRSDPGPRFPAAEFFRLIEGETMSAPKDWDDADVARVQAVVGNAIVKGTNRNVDWYRRNTHRLALLAAGAGGASAGAIAAEIIRQLGG